jgi:hypothetical protein
MHPVLHAADLLKVLMDDDAFALDAPRFEAHSQIDDVPRTLRSRPRRACVGPHRRRGARRLRQLKRPGCSSR